MYLYWLVYDDLNVNMGSLPAHGHVEDYINIHICTMHDAFFLILPLYYKCI